MLGLIITGLIFGGAAIGAAIDNAQMMKDPVRHLDDGTPVYIDRKCKQHINGEKVETRWMHDAAGGIKLVDVGKYSGRIYNDPEENKRIRMVETYEKPSLEEARVKGYLTYKKWYPEYDRLLSTELSTGKIIVAIDKVEDWKTHTITYKKYYYKGGYTPLMLSKDFYFENPKEGDTGVEITKEEYNKLDRVNVSYKKSNRTINIV